MRATAPDKRMDSFQTNRLVTTPAYMLGPGIKDVAQGIQKLVDQVMKMAG